MDHLGTQFPQVAILPIESVLNLFVEYAGWFGSPALLRGPPEKINSVNFRELILDGRGRFEAILALPELLPLWMRGNFPHYIFPTTVRNGLYSTDGNKFLPRMLVLAGHHDRAWEYVPEVWRTGPRDIETILNLDFAHPRQNIRWTRV